MLRGLWRVLLSVNFEILAANRFDNIGKSGSYLPVSEPAWEAQGHLGIELPLFLEEKDDSVDCVFVDIERSGSIVGFGGQL